MTFGPGPRSVVARVGVVPRGDQRERGLAIVSK